MTGLIHPHSWASGLSPPKDCAATVCFSLVSGGKRIWKAFFCPGFLDGFLVSSWQGNLLFPGGSPLPPCRFQMARPVSSLFLLNVAHVYALASFKHRSHSASQACVTSSSWHVQPSSLHLQLGLQVTSSKKPSFIKLIWFTFPAASWTSYHEWLVWVVFELRSIS